MQTINSARLGDTAVEVSQLGFGGGGIGNLYAPVSDAYASAAIKAAFAVGVRYFDTAPHYGFGLSETRLGAALAELDPSQTLTVSSKVGRVLVPTPGTPARERHGFVDAYPFEPVFDYSFDGVMRSFEETRRRLRRERIDILLAHDLGPVTHGEDHQRHLRTFLDGGYRAMQRLKDEGMIRAIGLGVNEWQICETVLAHADLDVFLLAGRYTLLDQTALETFLPACEARHCSLVIGGPFNSGILATGVGEGVVARYDYAPAPPLIIDRVKRLEAICQAYDVPLAAAALQFPLGHPTVVSVIPGIADEAQARKARQLLDHPIPQAAWDDMRAEGLLRPEAPTPAARAGA